MTREIVNKQKTFMQGKVRVLRIKPAKEDPDKTNVKRERFLALLKRRYGYTNDKAIEEMDRLLRQFYKTNRSLAIHHTHPVVRHPGAG